MPSTLCFQFVACYLFLYDVFVVGLNGGGLNNQAFNPYTKNNFSCWMIKPIKRS